MHTKTSLTIYYLHLIDSKEVQW